MVTNQTPKRLTGRRPGKKPLMRLASQPQTSTSQDGQDMVSYGAGGWRWFIGEPTHQ